ncbi:hypothetical protein RND71_044134 [Anisodus tanguticus]|uniref:Carrier domain-containing protein n=1 Tax=Anisodus tanguticus TaxID=243964 RepID=A0AAE1QMZ2_9SOLA|nr:hypothetical protein RND71_044134 [Anisodus tanguticus]
MIKAKDFGSTNSNLEIELTELELDLKEEIKKIWMSILGLEEINDETNFFDCGAGSMDVTRLVEEIKELVSVKILNEDVYIAPDFGQLVNLIIIKTREGDTDELIVEYDGVEFKAKNKVVKVPTQLFINNEFVNSSKNNVTEIINPATEEIICKVQRASKFDVVKAVNSAYNAYYQGDWSKMNARDRGKLLTKLADLMEKNKEELSIIESYDSGAVYTLALKTHVGMSIDSFRYFAGWCDKIHGKTIPINNNRPNKNFCFTRKEPFGVCALITPWNYPLMMICWKMGAALAAGNCVIVKPPTVCPLTALKLAELVKKAGFPPGVVNILCGSGAEIGDLLARDDLVRKLAFTGSTEIGKVIMQTCGSSNLKKVTLELGGKSPLVIFDDCDMDKAIKNTLSSVFFNKGENCIAAGRIFIQENIHDEFIEKLIVETKKIKIGDPLDRTTSHGPQNHLAHLNKLLEYIEIGKKEGAKLVYGGKRLSQKGYYLEPTIFTDIKDGTYLATEESFGPIMCISKFSHLDEVILRANNNTYGLASGVFTNDLSKAMKFSEKIEAGTCFVNCYNKTDVAAPFGGFKQSGFGKDLGEDALNEYLKTKTVTIEY